MSVRCRSGRIAAITLSSRQRALHDTASQLLLDLEQEHDGQDDQGSHEGGGSKLHATALAPVIRCDISELHAGTRGRAGPAAPV
jgi:hypothetical protein